MTDLADETETTAPAQGDEVVQDTPAPAPGQTKPRARRKSRAKSKSKTDPKAAPVGVPDGLMGDLPPVRETAVETMKAEEEAAQAPEPQGGAKTDASGTVFDPQLHRTNAAGEPVKTAKGNFAKRPGRRGGSTASQSTIGGRPPVLTPEQTEEQRRTDASRQAGVVMANTMLSICMGVFGEEWVPSDAEKMGLEHATGEWAVAQGIEDFPPGVALVMAWGTFAVPRFFQPKTKARVAGFVAKAKEWRDKRKDKEIDETIEHAEHASE